MPSDWSLALKPALALTAWAVGHSIPAADRIKRAVSRRFGERVTSGLYRAAYNGFALISFGLLLRYLWRLPDRPLYDMRGRPRALLRAGQAASLLAALDAGLQVGPGLFSGLRQGWELFAGGPVSVTPVAQHPLPWERDGTGWRRAYRLSRHPLNTLVAMAYWLSPVMTVKWAAVGAVTALYTVLGSWHEESRLVRAYGERYGRYREEVPHLFLPLGRWASSQRRRR